MNMPTMPGMPSANTQPEENVNTSLPAEQEEAKVETSESEEETESERPTYVTSETTNNSVMNLPRFPKNGIEVEATRKGFYNQNRINPGKIFKVKKPEHLATWMKCTDPDLEKERVKLFKEKANKVELKKDQIIADLKKELEELKKAK